MKNIISVINEQNKNFEEHLSDSLLAEFLDQKLEEHEREEVFKHLSECKRCRDVLATASRLKKENEPLVAVNNVSYFKAFRGLVAGVMIFFVVPYINIPSNDNFKASSFEKNIFDRSVEYWEGLFDKYGELWFK